jgi:predicted nuclease with TOPRIM domain
MRKLMAAVLVVSGLGLVTGCERKGEVQRQRENVAEAQREVGQEKQEMNQEVASSRQDAQEDVNEARQDLAKEQSKLAEKEYEQLSDNQATGGSGMASNKLEEVKGTIQSASGSNLTIIVPDKDNQLMRFKSDSQVKVMHDDKALSMSSLKAGDEIRASYQVDPNGQMLLRSVEVTKTSAKSLPDMPDMAK